MMYKMKTKSGYEDNTKRISPNNLNVWNLLTKHFISTTLMFVYTFYTAQ